MVKSFRHKNGGIHTELAKRLLLKSYWGTRPFNTRLPKPVTRQEFFILSKFIFGVELDFTISNQYNQLDNFKGNLSFERFKKLNQLNKTKADYIPAKIIPSYLNHRDNKMVLLSFSYECTKLHYTYYDNKFAYEVYDSCYELDSSFWFHVMGYRYCGGIGGYCYGQVDVTSLKEQKRLIKLFSNTLGVRKSFINKMKTLEKLNKTLSLKVIQIITFKYNPMKLVQYPNINPTWSLKHALQEHMSKLSMSDLLDMEVFIQRLIKNKSKNKPKS